MSQTWNAWGNSWGSSWAGAWGTAVVPPAPTSSAAGGSGGGAAGGTASRRKVYDTQAWVKVEPPHQPAAVVLPGVGAYVRGTLPAVRAGRRHAVAVALPTVALHVRSNGVGGIQADRLLTVRLSVVRARFVGLPPLRVQADRRVRLLALPQPLVPGDLFALAQVNLERLRQINEQKTWRRGVFVGHEDSLLLDGIENTPIGGRRSNKSKWAKQAALFAAEEQVLLEAGDDLTERLLDVSRRYAANEL